MALLSIASTMHKKSTTKKLEANRFVWFTLLIAASIKITNISSNILDKETFRLHYTFHSEDQQVIDICSLDNMGNTFDLSFSFNDDNSKTLLKNDEVYRMASI